MKPHNSLKRDKFIPKKGLLKNEVRLLIPFIKAPWQEFTLAELKLATKYISHHYVYDGLKRFNSESIININRRDTTNVYRLNENTLELYYFILAEFYIKTQNTHIPFNVIKKIQDRINPAFYSLLVTGSYASNKQKQNSDLDLCIIIPNSAQKKHFEIALKEGELTIPEVHGFVFTEDEFYQMLVNKEFNYGKECVKNHILISGFDAYYKILLKGLQNGFKG